MRVRGRQVGKCKATRVIFFAVISARDRKIRADKIVGHAGLMDSLYFSGKPEGPGASLGPR